MFSGKFLNCYGLKDFELPNIDFSTDNKAMIYAPNGVMKTSLSKVMDDISKGIAPRDRVFPNATTCYEVKYCEDQYTYSSERPNDIPPATDSIYVINTFADQFDFTKETVGTILADEQTRNEYNVLMNEMNGEIQEIQEGLRKLTGLTKPKIKARIMDDFSLSDTADWPEIFEVLKDELDNYEHLSVLDDVFYIDLINEKTLAVYDKPEFSNLLGQYIESLNKFLEESPLLNKEFTDKSAEALIKAFKGNNLFAANHSILLRDETTRVCSIEEWDALVSNELKEIYAKPELSLAFMKLKKLLTANAEVSKLRDIIISHRSIIPLLADVNRLRKILWLNCISRMNQPFDVYYQIISSYSERIKALYEKAAEQSQRWQNVVSEFNRRFRVPFEVKIMNKANFLLKDEAPNLVFDYSQGEGDEIQTESLGKDELMTALSTGEKRALYLLYILFDVERIRQMTAAGTNRYLIIADDIADSFDYKNKYAIIEYLSDLSKVRGIDLLILTHNFDFYRTVKSRLGIGRSKCFVAQREPSGKVVATVFKYQKDFFKNVVISNIKSGDINTEIKKRLLISSIPFYRNLCEYNGDEDSYLELTCFLHMKTTPLDTKTVNISDLWNIIKGFLNNTAFAGTDENFYVALKRSAEDIVNNPITDEVSLDNKLILSICIRLLAEEFLQQTLIRNGQACVDSTSNQTREWFELARSFMTSEQIAIIENVNLITPESIHLNSFMFEPLIDISDWTLRELYFNVKNM
ncbi:MAG: AAA family ATPase [Lachnospiraceae bacterium]|nr:AAA family ATPase [Lachnospiraceae bacterium]